MITRADSYRRASSIRPIVQLVSYLPRLLLALCRRSIQLDWICCRSRVVEITVPLRNGTATAKQCTILILYLRSGKINLVCMPVEPLSSAALHVKKSTCRLHVPPPDRRFMIIRSGRRLH